MLSPFTNSLCKSCDNRNSAITPTYCNQTATLTLFASRSYSYSRFIYVADQWFHNRIRGWNSDKNAFELVLCRIINAQVTCHARISPCPMLPVLECSNIEQLGWSEYPQQKIIWHTNWQFIAWICSKYMWLYLNLYEHACYVLISRHLKTHPTWV